MNYLQYGLDDFLDEVYEFNTIAGNEGTTKEAFLAQHKCLKEEVDEVLEAIENNDLENLTKEVIDVLYVAGGLVQKLEKLGVNIQQALSEVAANNLTKFPKNEEVLINSIAEHLDKGNEVKSFFNEEYQVHVLKNKNLKVVKPSNYKKADISEFVPTKNIY